MRKLILSEQEWREKLTPRVFHVTREAGTEPPFANPFWDNHAKGRYCCACCELDLFHSGDKFDSGTGWPSFFQSISPQHLQTVQDCSHLMIRTEVLCARCDAHLGHLFADGPQPTGLRYCINSASLSFVPDPKP